MPLSCRHNQNGVGFGGKAKLKGHAAKEADMGAIAVRQLLTLARPSSCTTLQGNAPYLNSSEIDDHLGVYRLLPFNDGAPEACRSLAS